MSHRDPENSYREGIITDESRNSKGVRRFYAPAHIPAIFQDACTVNTLVYPSESVWRPACNTNC